jgi:hypothetical protein
MTVSIEDDGGLGWMVIQPPRDSTRCDEFRIKTGGSSLVVPIRLCS